MARIFDRLVGHTDLREQLLTAWAQNQLPHGILLVGDPGIGKKLLAQALGQALVCEVNRRACGKCPACLRWEKGESESLLHIAPDGLQIKVEQAQRILNFLHLKAWSSVRVVLIEEAQTLNVQAANTLLKSLEEPPDQTFFILTSPSSQGVLSTIRSRCQTLRFSPLSVLELQQWASQQESEINNHKYEGGAWDDWMWTSCLGRLDLLQSFRDPELQEQRQKSLLVWEKIGEEQPITLAKKMNQIVGRGEGKNWLYQWGRMLMRDALFYRLGLTPLLQPDAESAMKKFSQYEERVLHWLYDELVEVEEGESKNWDQLLAWEAFFIRAEEVILRSPSYAST